MPKIAFNGKTMTVNANNPAEFNANGKIRNYFVNRIQTTLIRTLGQHFRTSVYRQRVDLTDEDSWLKYVPVLNWFIQSVDYGTGEDDENDFDVITYQFKPVYTGFWDIEDLKTNPSAGLIGVTFN